MHTRHTIALTFDLVSFFAAALVAFVAVTFAAALVPFFATLATLVLVFFDVTLATVLVFFDVTLASFSAVTVTGSSFSEIYGQVF
jgi:hypothetical protein